MRENSKTARLITMLREKPMSIGELTQTLQTSNGALRVYVCGANKFLHGERIERVKGTQNYAIVQAEPVDTVLAG